MKILITGSNGFLGKNLSEHFSAKHELFLPSHSELDLLNSESVREYIYTNEIDQIIHCANFGGNRDSAEAKNVVEGNLRMFFNIVRNQDSVERILYFGSGAEYGKHRNLKKVSEQQFDEVVPKDDYGFYKYVCNKYVQKSKNIFNLRLFGVFGKYENYEMRFISNAIVKNLLGMDITLNQNVVFDYLYVSDLMKITEYFLTASSLKFSTYNITPDTSIDLATISEIINNLSQHKSRIKILNPGMNFEYTASNSRLKNEIKDLNFTPYEKSISELYSYYKGILPKIDKDKILQDPFLSKCTTKE